MASQAASTRRTKPIRHVGFLRHGHFRWAIVAFLVAGAAIWAYVTFEFSPRPNGGTWYGYLVGTFAGLLILWLTMLGIRKRRISPGSWTLKGWVSAHVYLGLSLTVLATLHTGFQFGWNLHTVFYAVMMLVIISGAVGVILYAVMPRALSANRGEMTERDMLAALGDLDRQMQEAAMPLSQDVADAVRASISHSPVGGGLIKRLFNLYGGCGTARARKVVDRELNLTPPADRTALNRLEDLLTRKTETLTRARGHARIRAVLESWLYIHVPATIAVLFLLTAHIIAVFFYA